MKRYKFQALVTMGGDGTSSSGPALDSVPRRMVLCGHCDDTGASQMFSALVSCEDAVPFRPNGHQQLATLRLIGDDVPTFLDSGSHFDLWRGGEVGHGVVTRRLFS
jgi:hypothetical protein